MLLKNTASLTKRQEEILRFIQDRIENSEYPPTISEIQERFSFKSPNAVQDHLKALERKGKIRRQPNKWRGLEVIGHTKSGGVQHVEPLHSSATVTVPLIGRVAAGRPILAEENIEGIISVDRSLVGQSANLFALHVRGDSMINTGILNGDIVVARQQSTAENGDIVIALLDEEATVKRFRRKKNFVLLIPENDTMPQMKIAAGEDFKILGRVVATLRSLQR